ncbi:MAG: glycerophosphodiester phosphodiesterase [Thermodesulfovibrionales bacterium]|nr:glycerophosphodiester phosphodiesterase [Thermodesulfovibrionales bacterium]
MFLKIGHRGARAYEVENTLDSFKRAIELGVNAIEFDVRASKDGKLIVFHDDNLKRVFGKDIELNASPLNELKRLTENKIPTLEEALQFIGQKTEKILIELKETGDEKKALAVIKKEKLLDRTIIVSFHEEALSEIRKLDSKIETGLIYTRHKNPISSALKLKAQYLVALYKFTHTKNIEDAHKKNLKVIVWTINTKEEAEEYRVKGVDGIASDKPDVL